MTSHVPCFAARAGTAALALVAFAVTAPAQTPPTAAPPPQPAPVNTPALLKPPTSPPPPAAAPLPTAAARGPATAAAVRPATRAGLPLDSVRPATGAVSVQPPANAVARCGDGTFVVPPATTGACATHRGLRAVMPAATVPPPAATSAVAAPMTVRAPAPTNATAPAGATMRCRDGTYLTGAASNGRCDAHGGIAATLPPAARTPPAPNPVRRP